MIPPFQHLVVPTVAATAGALRPDLRRAYRRDIYQTCFCLFLMMMCGLGTPQLRAQSLSVLEWNFGTATYTAAANVKHGAVSTGTVILNANSGASLTATGTGTTSDRQMQLASWNGTETTTLTSGRTSTTPVSASKVVYTAFTVNSAAGGDFSALNVQLGYQRTASNDPTKVRAYLTWLESGTWRTRYSAIATLSGTTMTTLNLPLNTGSAAPTAIAGNTFLLELHFWGTTSSPNKVNIDNLKFQVNNLDFPDYGDSSLITTNASSFANGRLKLGATVDSESTAITNATATGDDVTNTDDEDGITLPATTLVQGQAVSMIVETTNTMGTGTYLNAWVDFNRNGVLTDSGEQVASNMAVANGSSGVDQTVNFNVPSGASLGNATVRVRLTSTASPGPTGASGTGEVEDQMVTFVAPTLDYGDDSGLGSAFATANTNLRLGALVDAEYASAANSTATGDNTSGSNDEDGVTVGSLVKGRTATVTMTVTNNSGATGYLSGWIDWNNDGDMLDDGEQVVTSTAITTGTTSSARAVTIDVPVGATTGTLSARFRFGSVNDPDPTGDGGTGEVEDYAVTVSAPPATDFAVVIVNYNNNSISRFNGTDGAHLATWTPSGLNAPNYGYRLSDNTLLVANGSGNTITKYNPFTGASLGTLIASGNGLNFPYQMAIGPEGLVYIANQGGNNILKFNGSTGGSISTVASLTSPAGLAFDSSGKIYVTQNIASGALKIYSNTGTLQSTVYTWGSGENPRGLAWGPDGRLYVNVRDNTNNLGRVDAFTFPGGTRSTFVTLDAGSNPYTGIKWGPDGNLYVVDYGESQVQVYSSTGAAVRTLSTSLSGPHAVAFTDLSANTLDYGDFSSFGIAASTQTTGLKLGNEVDTEGASRASSTANGDDIDDLDDEDGVTLPTSISKGAMTTISVKLTNTTGSNAYLNAWWDFNRNGSLTDSGEKIINNVTVATGTNNATQTYTVSVPVDASTGLAGLRFRLSSTSSPNATGTSGNGEVEDYTVTINSQGSDYGDFSGVASASSTVNNSLRLGALVDVESAATSNTAATGDDTTDVDDEDGVTMPASIPQGTSITIPVSVYNNTGANAYLSAWIDFNNDGTLNNTLVSAGGERLEAERTIASSSSAQPISVTFTSPNAASIGTGRGVRFRLTTATGATATGVSGTGEVEDYTATIISGLSLGNLVWNDSNDNGLKDPEESGINNVLVELWTPGADNAIGGTSANADTKVATVNTSGGGLYTFAGLTAGHYFVKVPTPPLSRVSSVVDIVDNGQDDDNDGAQPGGSSTSAYSPVVQLAAGTEPGSTGTGNADTTIDFGFVTNIGSPFVCDNRFYVMQNAETSAGSGVYDSTLYYIGPDQELIPVFIFEGEKLNGLAAYGGYLYCVDQNGNHLYRINAAGILVDMGAVPGLPAPGSSGQWSGATALTSGRMILNEYVTSPSVQTVLYTLDLATVSLVGSPVTCVNAATGTAMGGNFGDIAWDPLSNKVYGYNTVESAWIGLFEINTSTGVCTRVDVGEAGSFGSLVIDANGLAYGYGSSGSAAGSQDTLWMFNRTGNVLDGSMTAVGNGPIVSNSDGAACPGAAPSMKIGNLVWNDVNNNGIKDSGEAGIDGVSVKLFLGGSNPLTATAAATATTAGGGLYTFSNLSPGQYFVYISTPPVAFPLSSSVTDTTDNGQDNDDNGAQTAPGQPVKSPSIALTAGTEPTDDGDTDANTDLSIDFGFRSCPTIVVAPTTLATATVGTAYTQTVTASGGTSPYTWAVSSGALPSWATLNTTTGVISGTPNNVTSATFTLRATDSPGCTGTLSYTLTPACTTITVVPTTLPMAAINTAYTQATAFSASGMSGTYNFGATSVPTGMTFDATNKKLIGTPTVAGLFNVAVTATSASYSTCAGTTTVPFRVCPLIALTPSGLDAGVVGTAYAQASSFGGSGGSAPYTLTVTGVPAGLSYDPSTRRLIGTPTTPGTYSVQVSATDANGCPASLTLPLVISCPSITVAPSTLPMATVNSTYVQTPVFSASGLTGSYTWSATSLPTGMTFDSANRRLTGAPTATGLFNVVATATDSTYASCKGSVTVPFRVCPVISIAPVSLPGGMVSIAYSQSIAFAASGGTSPYVFGTPTGIPAGMSWDSVNLKLIGTPTTAGTTAVTLTVADVNGCPGSLTVPLVISPPADYGDWNGAGAATTTTFSTVNTNLRLGSLVDAEVGVTPNANATTDNITGSADEEGVVVPANVLIGSSVTLPVTVFNNTGASAYLNAWIDFNNDGTFNDTLVTSGGERLEAARTIASSASASTQNITFFVPASASAGSARGVRFRITNQTPTPPTGSVGAGEVEDYVIKINPSLVALCPNSVGQFGLMVTDGSFSMSNSASGVYGGTGFASGVSLSVSGGGLSGNVGVHPPQNGSLSSADTLPGTGGSAIVPVLIDLSAVRTEALSMSSQLTAMTATQTFGDITNSTTITATGQQNVIALNSVKITNGTLTLQGGPNDFFFFNVSSEFSFSGASGMALAGGVVPQHVIVNMLPASTNLKLTGSSVAYSGTFLAVQSTNVTTLSGASIVTGSVYARSVTLTGGSLINRSTFDCGSQPYDYGDYPNFVAASRYASPDILIGTNATDAETATPTTGLATADDGTGIDDEELTIPSVSPGFTTSFTVPVTLSGTVTAGRLMVWADWDDDNSVGGTNEVVTSSAISLVAGSNNASVTFSPPAATSIGTHFIRLITQEGTSTPAFSGTSTNRGEVEDYAINVVLPSGVDYGDLPDTGTGTGTGNYKTVQSDSGAAHKVISGLLLGATVDSELDATPDSTATGDGADDDGVVLPALVKGATTSINVSATNLSGSPAYLNLWIDWNNNGSFEDSGEKMASDVAVATGTNNGTFSATFTVPAAAVVGAQTGVRVRLSQTSGLLSYGLAMSGEVEDYMSAPVVQGITMGDLVWNDVNNDGTYQSASESGISGVTVTALGFGSDNTQGTGDDTTATTTTAAGGAYSFILAPGKYIIRVTPTGAFPLASAVVTSTDNGLNNDNNGLQTGGVNQPVDSPVITLTAGSEPGSSGSTNTETTIDFGLRACPTIAQGAAGSWTATQYAAYSQTITASGGVAPYTWTRSGTLPGGLTFTSGSPGATITGTPDGVLTVGNYPITLTVTDALGCSSSQNFTLVLACPTIAVAGTLPDGVQDDPYTQTLTASGGTGPYTWSVTGTLPTGITTATPSTTTFRLSGTPTVVESRTFTIRATDKWGCFKDTSYTIAVGCPVITINPASPLTTITQYTAMTNVVFSAVGGRSPYAWSIDSATPLPAGLSFGTGTATLSGTATAAPGTYNFNVKLVDNSGCPGSKPYAITILCPTVTISTSATLNAGTTGTAFTQTLAAATAGTGVPAQTYSWSRTIGTLPPGLTLSTGGVLSGTPTAAGSYSFTIAAANQQGCSGAKAFTMNVSCPTLVLSPSTLPVVAQYASYSQTFSTTGGTAPYTYSVLSGTLPGGTTLSGTTLSGTVTAIPGSYGFTIRSTDANNCTTSQAYTVVVNCPTISVAPATAGPFTQYSTNSNVVFSATGGTSPYNWSIDSATPLPAGLTFTPATATLSGAPTAAPGSYAVNVKVVDQNNCPGNRSYTIVINCNTVSLAPGSLPAGVVGSSYSQTVTATLGGSGVPAQTWTYSLTTGALPAGLSLNSSTGAITGIPTGVVTASFTLRAVNAQGCSGSQAYTITTGCPTVAFSTGSTLPMGTQYTTYSTALAATGGTQPYTWSLLSGALPTGLSLNGGTGIISGVPTAAPATYVFTLRVSDNYGCAGTRAFNMVLDCPVITITPQTLPPGVQYAAYTQALTATTTGTNVPAQSYLWSVSVGQLPTGLTLNPSTGVISGTPTMVGSQTFTVQVKDSNNCIGVITYTLPVDCPPIFITPTTLPAATQYAAYTQQLSATGGTSPYGWSLDTGSNALPAGLTLSAGGSISGSPSAAPGNYTFRVKANDANNCPGYQNYTLTIGCPTLTFSSASLSEATTGIAYSQSITASGGTSPYTFTITTGAPPVGLAFNGSDGAVTGTPNVMPGLFSFTVRGTDSFGCTGTQGFTVQVNGRDYGDYSGVGSASALVSSTLKLGAGIDPEGPGITNSAATADDIAGLTPDDEDGVTAPALRRGQTAVIKAAVNNGTGASAYVSGWIDYNNSGTFDAGEQFATDVTVAAGTTNGTLALPVVVPFTATTATNLALRVRLSAATGRAATGDDASSGEVEDYLVQVLPAVTGVGNVVFKDSNSNSRYDAGEGVDGVLVQLFAQGGGVPLASVTTSGSGRYTFSDLTPGNYFVKIPASEFASGKGLFNSYSVLGNGGDTGTDDATDENGIDVSNAATAGVSTGVFALAVGGEPLSRPGTELGMDAHSDDGQIVTIENNAGNTGVVAKTYLTLNDYYGGNALTTVAGSATFAAGSFEDMTYDPTTSKFMAWLTSGNLVSANSISDLVTATGTYTSTTSAFSGFGVNNFSRTLGIEMVGSTIYTIESNSGGTGIVGRTYSSLANWYAGTVSSTATGSASFGAASFRSLGYDRVSGLFYGYYDPSGNGSGQVVTAATIGDLVGATGTYANLGTMHFGQGVTNYGKILSLVNMAAVTTGDSNIDLTVDLGFAPCQTINVSPASIAAVTQYTPISNITLTASGGNAPYVWSIASGALPAGLSLSSAGVLSGNPTALAGTYNVTVQAVDAYSCVGTKAYSIVVNCPTITIAPGTIPAATQYSAYSQTFSASTAGTGVPAQTYSWSLSSGTLPAGLSLNTTSGVISGTPTGASAPGNYPITLRVQNSNGCFATAGYTLVLSCPTITIAGTLADGVQDEAYTSGPLSASGGTGSYIWSVTGSMPTGLSINSTTGVVSGMPTVVQSATFTVRATDSNGCVGTKNYTIAIGCPVITINPPTPLNPVTQYTAMTSVAFSAVGGRTPYLWSIDSATPLPSGLTFTPATATLSGTPTAVPGTYNFTVKLIDNSGCPGSKAYSITVNCPAITVNNASPLPNGVVGSTYSQTLTATTNGTGVPAQTYTWSLASGTLPAGLSLSSGGLISGTPTATASATVTVQATNAQGCSGTKALALTVVCPTITLNPASLPAGYVNGAYNTTVSATGGTAPYSYAITNGTLPSGLAFNTSSGQISGTPTGTANVNLTIQTTDRYNCTGSITYPLVIKSMGIGNLVYADCNNSGTFDAGDTGLAGAVVQLFRPGADNSVNTADDVQVGSNFTTSSTGVYSFTSIPPGNYFVKVTPPASHQKSGGVAVTSDSRVDNDNNGAQSAIGAPLFSPVISLADGAEPTNDGDTDAGTDWTVDFGIWSGMQAGNLVWNDVNNNGVKDSGETGISGLTVELISPGADNAVGGVGGNADSVVASTTTASDGAYGFLVYTMGGYFIRVNPPGAYPLPSGVSVASDNSVDNDNNGVSQPAFAGTYVNTMVFDLSGCEMENTIDVGLRACPTISVAPGSLAEAVLGAEYSSGSITASGGTAPYTWSIVSGALPTGLALSTTSGSSAGITGVPSGAANSYNVGLQVRDALGCITTRVYAIAVSCPLITITPATLPVAYQGAVFSQTLTSTGSVGAVLWSVNPALPAGLALNASTGVISGTPTAPVGVYNIVVTSNDSNNCQASISYALAVRSMGIGNIVWYDCNNNGLKDSGETGLAGAVVTLCRSGPDNTVNTADDVVLGSSVTTTSTGAYSFTGFPPGNYYVKVVPPAGYNLTGGSAVVLDNRADNDNNGAQPGGLGTPAFSPIINLADGTEPITDGDTDANSDWTIDFGFWTGFTVGDRVWYDANADGLYQSGSESGVSGLTVELLTPGTDNAVGGSGGAADTVVATTTTNATGVYGFTVYVAGSYYVRVAPNTTYPLVGFNTVQSDNGVDGDNNGVQPAGAGAAITSMVFALAPCTEPAAIGADNIENTIDFAVRNCPTITLSPTALANATQYQNYNQSLTASGAVAPYTWTVVSGALPAGITLTDASSTTATLTGIATATPGTYNFTLRATDALNCTGTRNYSVVVNCPTITIAPGTIPTATQFVAYSQTFTASTAGTGVPVQTYTWSLSSGTLPAGLALSPTSGVISGTPTGTSAPGNYPITLRVQNGNGCLATAGYTLVLGCPTVTIAGTLTNGVQDAVYTPTTLTASGGSAPYTWTVVGAMPTGLVLNSSTGVVSGTPTVVQSATFTVRATDANGCVGTQNYTIAVDCPVITISPVSPLNPVTQYTAMNNVVFSAVGGRTPYLWSIDSATPLPTGLSFNPATATLSGIPTALPGTYNFMVNLLDNSGCPGSKAYSITVNCPAIAIGNPSPLPNGVVGTAYTQTLTATTNGTGVPAQTYIWSVASGTLPAGLSLSSAGILSGTPTAPASSTVTFQATNGQGCAGTKALALTVVCPTITLSPSTLPAGFVNGTYNATLSANGGTAPYVYSLHTGTLPNGLVFNTTTGALTGMPTTVGSSSLVFRATDSYGCIGSITYTLPIRTMGIGNLVWDDSNNNGIKDLTESGLAGATVQLFRSGPDNVTNSADDVQVGSTQITTGSGAYNFTNIPPGNYFVKVTPPSTHQKSGGSAVGIDSRTDNDNNGNQSAIGAPLYSPIIGLADGLEPVNDGDTDSNTDWTVDFGIYSGVRVGNLVWADDDQDGIRDPGESGIGGLTVQLMSPGSDNAVGGSAGASDTVVATTTTAPDGSYGFLVYVTGNYFVCVMPNGMYMLPSLNPVAVDNGVDNDNNAVLQPLGAGTLVDSMVFALTGSEVDNTIDIALRECPILLVNPTTIGPVTQYTPVKVNLDVSGGTEPYTWNIQSGVLPEGLNLNTIGPATSVVSGNPTAVPTTYNVTIRVRDALGCILDVPYPILVLCPAIAIAPETIASAMQYVPYAQTFTASTDGTSVPAQTYTWSITGALPAGLNFNSSTGVLSGTPSASSEPGSYPITVRVQDGSGCFTTRGYTLELLCPQITVAGSVGDGVQDEPYSVALTANGGTAPYTWTVLGTLPVGLTLTPTGGSSAVLAGTPDMVESVMFSIIATDAHACQAIRPASIAINCPPIIISPPTLPVATQYAAITPVAFSAVGGRTPYLWSVDASTPVPAGLTFNAATATLSGTPTATPGVYPLTVKLVDKSGCPGSNTYQLTIACPAVAISPASLPGGVVGTAYNQTLSASMTGTGVPAQTWTWTLDSGTLPGGLTLNNTTGVLSGTPTVTATANITVRATNAQGCAGIQAFTLVTSCPGMAVTPGSLPDAVQFTPGYNQPLIVTGGTAPYTWSLTGSLPAGLTLNPTSGVISGTATASAASFPITVTVADSFGCAASKAYTLVVLSIDRGDLASLPTAGSYVVSGLKMGNSVVDADTPSQANVMGNGDDTVGVDDEDGVTFAPMTIGTTVLVSVKVVNTTAVPAYLNGWIDFNGNGTLEAGEQIVAGQVVNSGTSGSILDFSVAIPITANEQPVAARFRLSSDGATAIGGVSGNGEVEDYLIQLCQPRPCGKTYVSQN